MISGADNALLEKLCNLSALVTVIKGQSILHQIDKINMNF
jgi:hypothetical protein